MTTTEEDLRAWIDRKTGQLEARGPDYLEGDEWFQVTAAEQECVFR
jgi:hypothetical protein